MFLRLWDLNLFRLTMGSILRLWTTAVLFNKQKSGLGKNKTRLSKTNIAYGPVSKTNSVKVFCVTLNSEQRFRI